MLTPPAGSGAALNAPAAEESGELLIAAVILSNVVVDEFPMARTDVRSRLQTAPSITAYSTAVLPDWERKRRYVLAINTCDRELRCTWPSSFSNWDCCDRTGAEVCIEFPRQD